MVIYDLDVIRVSIFPTETDSPLIVDTNAVLALAAPGQLLKMVRGRNPQIVQVFRCVKREQLSQASTLDTLKPLRMLSFKDLLGLSATEAPNHLPMITPRDNSVKHGKPLLSVTTRLLTSSLLSDNVGIAMGSG